MESKYWDSVFDLRTYHVAAISFLEGTVKNALLYWCPLIIYSLVRAHPARLRSSQPICLLAGPSDAHAIGNGIDANQTIVGDSQVGARSSKVARELSEVVLPPPEAEGNAALVALLTALPFGLAAGWMLLLAKSSQRTGNNQAPGKGCAHSVLKLILPLQMPRFQESFSVSQIQGLLPHARQ